MNVVGYLRVSTAEQVDGQGLDVQEAAIRSWAAGQGHEIAAVYVDAGISGSNGLDTRQGLFDALGALDAGEADGLIAYNLDRLARKLTVQEAVLAKVWDGGHKVLTVEDGGEVLEDDPDDPMRTAMRQMRGVFAQLERGMITKRMRDGRRAKADKGGYAYGAPPYGWRASDGELEPIPGEQTVIAEILAMGAAGMTTRVIAAQLDDAGHPTRRGGQWQSTSVAKILRRERAGHLAAGDRAT